MTTFATTAAYSGLQFRVVVTDGNSHTVTSNVVTLTVDPAITTQPVSQTVTDGNTATFSVVAAGVPTLTYQWQYLSGSTWKAFGAGTGYTTATLTTFATTASYNGLQLRVVVTDGNSNTVTSNVVTLTVGPAITTQPVSQTVTTGNTATFSVVAAGVPTLTYQWQDLSGSTWKAFGAGTGYTTATMTTFATTAAYNGLQFRVVVTDGNSNSVTSNTVTLTVQ
jgi:D-alanyl-D-alanine carboxypeptidase